jgi:predicted DNA-binding transcriptional regulator AlpA
MSRKNETHRAERDRRHQELIERLPSLNRDYHVDTQFVADLFRVTTSHINRLRRLGQLPPAVTLGERSIRWRLGDVLEFVERRKHP